MNIQYIETLNISVLKHHTQQAVPLLLKSSNCVFGFLQTLPPLVKVVEICSFVSKVGRLLPWTVINKSGSYLQKATRCFSTPRLERWTCQVAALRLTKPKLSGFSSFFKLSLSFTEAQISLKQIKQSQFESIAKSCSQRHNFTKFFFLHRSDCTLA